MEEALLSLVYPRKTFVKQHLWARRWVAAKVILHNSLSELSFSNFEPNMEMDYQIVGKYNVMPT